MKSFEQLTTDELWQLRKEIVVNSIFVSDYENSFGFDSNSMCSFFNGYYEFIWELASEVYEIAELTHNLVMDEFDCKENLKSWLDCHDDLSWIVQD